MKRGKKYSSNDFKTVKILARFSIMPDPLRSFALFLPGPQLVKEEDRHGHHDHHQYGGEY